MVGKTVQKSLILWVCTLLVITMGCAGTKGQKRLEDAAKISCATCEIVAEYGGLVKLAGGMVSERMEEIQVQLGTSDVIDGLALACDFRNLVVDRRIDADESSIVSDCDERRRSQ